MTKKLILLAALTVALRMSGLLPFQSSDVAQLVPVQALVVSSEEGKVYLDGGGCLGMGEDWNTALQDLKQSAQGHVFLGTVDHLVLCGETVNMLQQIIKSEALRPAASVCVCPEGFIDAKTAGAYLSAHDGGVTLREIQALQLRPGKIQLPEIIQTQGGVRIHASHR